MVHSLLEQLCDCQKPLTVILEPLGNIHSLNIGRLFEGSCVQNKFMSHVPCSRTQCQVKLSISLLFHSNGQLSNSALSVAQGTKRLRELDKVIVGNKDFSYSITSTSDCSSPHTSDPGIGWREVGALLEHVAGDSQNFSSEDLKIYLERLNTILIL